MFLLCIIDLTCDTEAVQFHLLQLRDTEEIVRTSAVFSPKQAFLTLLRICLLGGSKGFERAAAALGSASDIDREGDAESALACFSPSPSELSRLGLGVLTGTSSWLVLSRSCRYKSKFRPFFLGGWAGANLRQLRELRHLSRTYITLALNDPKTNPERLKAVWMNRTRPHPGVTLSALHAPQHAEKPSHVTKETRPASFKKIRHGEITVCVQKMCIELIFPPFCITTLNTEAATHNNALLQNEIS